jgi:subtilisin family serine protease
MNGKKLSVVMLIILVNVVLLEPMSNNAITVVETTTKIILEDNQNNMQKKFNSFSFDCVDNLSWGADHIDAEMVWGAGDQATDVVSGNFAGNGTKLCIIDSGIYNHSDLGLNYKGGIDYIDGGDPEDTFGHGTKCAGVIGGLDNDFGTIGVAPQVNLYTARCGTTIDYFYCLV